MQGPASDRLQDALEAAHRSQQQQTEAGMGAQTNRLSRRNFLLTLGAGGAAAAAVAASKGVPQNAAPAKPGRTRTGYHESEHVRNYYRTAKV
jgi:hypothetical protein